MNLPNLLAEPPPGCGIRSAIASGGRPLRIALFSGNYNCVRDGANRALNRLVAHLLARGHEVRVYSPTIAEPAFAPAGDVVSVPSVAIPLRPEYRLAMGLPRAVEADVRDFAPHLIHLSAPDLLGRAAQRLARAMGVPLVSSLHTRFETYLDYYHLGFLRPTAERWLARFYAGVDMVLVPNAQMGTWLAEAGVTTPRRMWSRGVDAETFSPARRDFAWRRAHGFTDQDVVVLFFGRMVAEKGLDTFEAMLRHLRAQRRCVRPLFVGDGPARKAVEARLEDAVFTGHLDAGELEVAVASADILVNPSLTEAFGNVTLEAMASGLAVVAADVPATGALIRDGETGLIVSARDAHAYADAVGRLQDDAAFRLRLGRAARARAMTFNWDAILDSVVQAYQETLALQPSAGALPEAC
ncbi:MAG: glycosyltransferase family 4 protein [Thermaurantiacus sp.]